MHIAIDARELTGHRTGVGRYLDRLLTYWGRLPAANQHRFTLYAPSRIAGGWPLRWTSVMLPGGGGTRWEQGAFAAALRRDRPDVVFAPAYTAPLLTRVPIVLTVHDVSFVAHPEWFRPRDRWRRRLLTSAGARRAHTVLTVSEFSRGEIEARLGIAAARVRVVPPGIEFTPRSRPRPIQPPCVLYTGSILNRRHVQTLVRAVGIAARTLPDLSLVIAGDNRSWPREDPAALAAELGLGSRVDVRAFVDDEELAELYGSASVFAFLSEYEGFGLTPLEAMAAGVPPVVLDTPVAREVYGPAARYVARPDPDLAAAAIVELITSSSVRASLAAAAPTVLSRYRWEDTAAATLGVLESAAMGGIPPQD